MSALGQTEKNSVRAYVFPLYPQTRTLLDTVGMSQTCQTRKSPVVGQRRRHRNLKFNLVVSADC
jgi:hypothetical protein